MAPTVAEMLRSAADYQSRIEQVKQETLFHSGSAAQAAGKYLLSELSGKKKSAG